VLGALLHGAIWSRYSAKGYEVSEGGARLTITAETHSTAENDFRAALATVAGRAPMVVGGDGAGAMHYAEFEIFQNMFIGVGRPGLDVEQTHAYETEEFWGLYCYDGDLMHAGQPTRWDGQQSFGQGDTMGLLLDCGAGHLVVYKNGARLGVAAAGLTGELCWAAAMGDQGDSVRITGKLPPLPTALLGV
jgi:hypothetical protein